MDTVPASKLVSVSVSSRTTKFHNWPRDSRHSAVDSVLKFKYMSLSLARFTKAIFTSLYWCRYVYWVFKFRKNFVKKIILQRCMVLKTCNDSTQWWFYIFSNIIIKLFVGQIFKVLGKGVFTFLGQVGR